MTRPRDPGIEPVSVVVAALQARGRFGIRLGLGRTRALLARVGSPERSVRGVLIAGTNGKGSTQAMVASVLRAGGLRVGQTPKPHLVSYRERIVVDGRVIASADLDAVLAEVLAAADRVQRRYGPPTEFEVLTTAAFLWLARARVEVAVIEVGLGGRLDATNAWDGGVAAITNVALDHMEHLGHSVSAIAREKAAIIKRGDRAVTGAVGDALSVIQRRAARLEVPLAITTPLEVVVSDRLGSTLLHPALGTIRLGLLGAHQASNAAVAIAILEALADAGIAHVGQRAIRDGLAHARWPGRLELLEVHRSASSLRAAPAGRLRGRGTLDVVLDGAHNVDGARALAAALDALGPHLASGRATLVLGILADKDVTGMIGALRSSALLRHARVLATPVPESARTLDAPALARAWGAEASPTATADEALERGVEQAAAEDGPLVVAGSLYLVGHVRGRLTGGAVS
jgi:dihydrofolate synthase/folylpolyglutamate synthase